MKAKLAEPLAEDADLIRKMKPSLIKARAKGEAPTNQNPSGPARTVEPSARQAAEEAEGARGPNPWIVVGVALAAGIVTCEVDRLEGHAHPRD